MGHRIRSHPYRSLSTVLAVGVVCFLLSASGQQPGYWSNGPTWLGAAGWFGSLAAGLILVTLAGYLAAAAVRHRHPR
jgi:hypothetical protein